MNKLNVNLIKEHIFLWLCALTIGLLFLLFPHLSNFLQLKSWSTTDWIYVTQTCIFGVSAFIAYRTIESSKMVSREKATLEIILGDNKDLHLINAKADLLLFLKNPEKYYQEFALKHGTPQQPEQSDEKGKEVNLPILVKKENLSLAEENIRTKLLTVLSRHEFYAIGINAGLLDERLFKRMSCSNFIKLWDSVSPTVIQMRTLENKDTLFKDFELLAVRWKANPLRVEDIQTQK